MNIAKISNQAFSGKHLSVDRNLTNFPVAKKAILDAHNEIESIAKSNGFKVQLSERNVPDGTFRKGIRRDEIFVYHDDCEEPYHFWEEIREEINIPNYKKLLHIKVKRKSFNPLDLFNSKTRESADMENEQISKKSLVEKVKEMIEIVNENLKLLKLK